MEELQILRESVLRLLLSEDRPDGAAAPFSSRDILALNRVLDSGVAQASVAYVDDLFFAHLQGPGVPEGLTAEVEEEINRQLEILRKELDGQ